MCSRFISTWARETQAGRDTNSLETRMWVFTAAPRVAPRAQKKSIV